MIMNIIWHFNPQDPDDRAKLSILRNANAYHDALIEMDGLLRMLRNDPEVVLAQAGLNVSDTDDEEYIRYDLLLESLANQMSEILENVYLEE